MPDFTDTIAALGTPRGTAAIAVVRMSGPDTIRILGDLVGGMPPPRLVRRAEYRNLAGEVLDDTLLVFFRGPKSYTGEDSVEISCHGNPFIVQKILDDLCLRGCRSAEPGEFTQRAFLNGKMDLSQAEGVMDLIHARSERALANAHQHLRGALGRKMNGLVERLVVLIARVEAYIDFPEDDLPPEDEEFLAIELEELAREAERLLATSRYGQLLRDGVKTVIVGRPNVGKSSLLNRLVGRERALVSAEPGTTRDFIEERVVMGPHCVRLIDTAGLNLSPAPLEALGMNKTREVLEEADLFVLVAERGTVNQGDLPELPVNATQQNTVICLNKSDLKCEQRRSLDSGYTIVEASALTGAGISDLETAIVRAADALSPDLGSDTIAINVRHAHALSAAASALGSARQNLREHAPVELLASDLRMVLSAFGEIAGRVDNEKVLDTLFATFCIGK